MTRLGCNKLRATSLSHGRETSLLDLNERLKNICKRLHSFMGERVEIVIATKSDHALVEANPDHMDHMVMNLASNARDAMPHGGKFTLETSVIELEEDSPRLSHRMKAGEYIVLSVSDNGTGMDPKTQSHCFEPFFSTKDKDSAKGLGLTEVFAIVRSNGGDISLRSDPSSGTTFTIYLPSVERKKVDSRP